MDREKCCDKDDNAFCKGSHNLNGKSDVEAACSANRTLINPTCKVVKRMSLGSVKRGGSSDSNPDLVERIHISIWPKTDVEEFRRLLKSSPSLVTSKYGKNNDTLLHRAARHGKIQFVVPLLEFRSAGLDINAQNACGRTALHLAVHTLREAIVIRLLEAGADANVIDIAGDAPMHVACKAGSLTNLKVLLEQSVCYDSGCSGGQGNSLLHYAARYGHLDIMKYLIDDLMSDVNAKNHLTETPLHLASGVHKLCLGTKAIEFLLDHGANPHARTSFGDTPAHYAALGGSLRNLKFLVEEKGVSMSKGRDHDEGGGIETYHLEADELCDKYDLSEETRKEMKMTFLQKVAQSCCIEKSNWVIDGMMNTRMLLASNQSIGVNENDSWIVIYQELSERQREFKWMADELVMDIRSPDSALKIFLRRAPDCVEHLLNRCVVTFCKDQIQGNVFFDFFLLFPPPPPKGASADLTQQEVGELTLLETLIQARKERFLTHPVFETFLKLKWYRTWRLYLVILLMSATFTISLLGYVLTRFGNVLDSPIDPYSTDFWWYFLAVTSTYTALIDVCKIWYLCSHCLSCPKETANRLMKDPSLALHMTLSKAKDTAIPILSLVLLNVSIDAEVRRYVAAISAVLSCFNFMLALSRLPKVGIYIFMLNKVFGTIISFFISYFWHFLGYAVAFHVLMPGEDGAFSSLGNSIIKVLTMLMGEYDFTDTFANSETFWVSKVIFVLFVIDMSVVLMNLVLGLAVNDVESIQQDSRVRSMVHETLTVTYLEQICLSLAKIPVIGRAIVPQTRIVNSNTCQFKEIVFLSLVDLNYNDLNELVVDHSPVGGSVKRHPCPPTVAQGVVSILKDRKVVRSSLPDRKTQAIILELRQQNEQLQEQMGNMEHKLDAILSLVSDMRQESNAGD